ncbi:lipoprotein insertase outer membrane protein LolB [Pseudoalteromonas pernae]|uniref:lipoprotein insertase outer membrane protein LolB n=1 Tax=Pseudoalteromonas pernae TaxID=3118054 RepID=UPI00324251C0
MINFRLILLVFFLFITGCAQQIQKSTPPNDNWRDQLQAVEKFSAEGKMAFISTQKRQSANFVWDQHASEYSLDLNTFIGTNVLRLKNEVSGVELEVDGKHYQGDDAQRLVYELTGWLLPLSQPDAWLLGKLETGSQVDELNRVVSTTWVSPDTRQWRIRYDEYRAEYGIWLPTRITLEHDSLKVKLMINQWQIK